MPVELRKRKAPQPPPAPAPAAKKAGGKAAKLAAAAKVKKPAEAAKKPAETAKKPAAPGKKAAEAGKKPAAAEAAAPKKEAAPAKPAKDDDDEAPAAAGKAVAVGDVVDLDGFGGEIETHDGQKTSLKQLVGESKSGVVLFTYPKASTPGCTTQACLFRDSYDVFAQQGLSVFGLSSDSPKANTTFKEKQALPFPLLCDPKATLIAAVGLKKQPKGTQRGVFAVDAEGKVLLAEPGGPAATLERAKTLLEAQGK